MCDQTLSKRQKIPGLDAAVLKKYEREVGHSNMPAPELLGDIVNREPMILEQFLAFTDKSNPTLRQAQLNVDRSTLQAGWHWLLTQGES